MLIKTVIQVVLYFSLNKKTKGRKLKEGTIGTGKENEGEVRTERKWMERQGKVRWDEGVGRKGRKRTQVRHDLPDTVQVAEV